MGVASFCLLCPVKMAKAGFLGTEDFESGFHAFFVLFHLILRSKRRRICLMRQACMCPAIETVVNSNDFHLRGNHFGFVLEERNRQQLRNGMVAEKLKGGVRVKEGQETSTCSERCLSEIKA